MTHGREVADHADRIIVMHDGQVAEEIQVTTPRDAEEELDLLANGEDAHETVRIVGEGVESLAANKRTFFMMAGTIVASPRGP